MGPRRLCMSSRYQEVGFGPCTPMQRREGRGGPIGQGKTTFWEGGGGLLLLLLVLYALDGISMPCRRQSSSRCDAMSTLNGEEQEHA